ncbi:MAG: Dps family protein [Janthinobacterium lividum]
MIARTNVDVASSLNVLLADVMTLYVKTKNFHWHVSGPYFRDYHLLLDEPADQLIGTSDLIAERVRKLGHTTLRSVRQVAGTSHIQDNDLEGMMPTSMLYALLVDNYRLVASMKDTHELCETAFDIATASLLENWIDEADQRIWFLRETLRSD